MALTSPLAPSPDTRLHSTFSPWTNSPSSPALHGVNFSTLKRSSDHSDSLVPPPASPYPAHVDPSPTDSNGTDRTDIEDDAQEQTSGVDDESEEAGDAIEITSPKSPESLARIDTSVPARAEPGSEDAPASVIHAPPGFRQFEGAGGSPSTAGTTLSPTVRSVRSENTVVSPSTPDATDELRDKRLPAESPSVDTNVTSGPVIDRSTPKASTQQEADDAKRRLSQRTSSLEGIPEALDNTHVEESSHLSNTPDSDEAAVSSRAHFPHVDSEVDKLRNALTECWTLCNTLANLSSSHRNRMFASNRGGLEENAWRSCWRLCQQLYQSQDVPDGQVQDLLDLCRVFCQALFDARQRGDAASDSVLRVSFELTNHLYNIHDRELPQAFRQRTLDFYVALCHRMMKLRTSLPAETNALLRACWTLAEILFTLQYTSYETRTSEEELLGSAVQACWDLCDLFRDGWSQIRPERATPKPSQTSFPRSSEPAMTASDGRLSSLSNNSYHDATSFPLAAPPETPVTIFDDVTAPSSPDSVTEPNILVLGPASGSNSGHITGVTHHDRWSSNASTLSGYSEDASSSQHTTSSNRTVGGSDQAHLLRLRGLILKTAMLAGYRRPSGSSSSSIVSGSSTRSAVVSFQEFVQGLISTTFGSTPAQVRLLESYKKLVAADPSLRNLAPVTNKRFSTVEVAKAVRWLSAENEQWAWMRDLYMLVNGYSVEEAEKRGGMLVT